jgi:hypothetical protein
MRINTALPADGSARRWVTLAVAAVTISALGVVAVAQQKPASKSAATPTAITVYKTPT